MRYRIIALVLVLAFALCGCSEVVSDIAGNVADAAAKELENQVRKTVEEYKVEVVEVKSAFGKLDPAVESDQQFFCGVLVRSNSDAIPQSVAVTLGGIFEEAGCQPWHKSEIDNDHLVNKKISFKHSDFGSGDYFMIWGYTTSLTQKLTDKLAELDLGSKLAELDLPSIPEDWKAADGARETEAGVG